MVEILLIMWIHVYGVNVSIGWRTVLAVFSAGAADAQPQIAQLSFELIGTVVNEYLHLLSDNFALDELMKALLATANNSQSENSLHAIGMLQSATLHLAHLEMEEEQSHASPSPAPTPKTSSPPRHGADTNGKQDEIAEPQRPNLHVWFRILTGLSSLVADRRIEV